GADSVVIDLEEPRTPFPESSREAARDVVAAFLRDVGEDGSTSQPMLFARVQPPSTGQTLKDLHAVMTPALAGILLPKVYGPEDVHGADALLTCMEVEHGLEPGSVVMYPILETAQALRCAYDIATASPRVTYMGG